MKDMQYYAKQFQHEHKDKGVVSDVTDYSLKYTTNPKKPTDKPESCIVMQSWFWEREAV